MHDGGAVAARTRSERTPRRRLLGTALLASISGLMSGLLELGSRHAPAIAASRTTSMRTAHGRPVWIQAQTQAPTTGSRSVTGFGVGGDEGRALWFLDGLVVWKAVGADTGGQYELVEQLGAADYAAPLHIHTDETEGFYVVEGDLTMMIGGRRFHAGPGAFGYVPIGVPHAFRVESPTAKFLTFITPPGLEGYFEELGQEATTRTLPPPGLVLPTEAQIEAVAQKYGTQILGPFPDAP